MPHPLDPLTPSEISEVSQAIRSYALENSKAKAFKFIQASLIPPKKLDVLRHLQILPGDEPDPAALIRRADVDFIDPLHGNNFNASLNYQGDKWVVQAFSLLPDGVEPQITPEELNEADEAVRRNPQIIKLAADIGVSPEQLHADGWSIGYDDRFGLKRRLQQCLLFARLGPHENLYAHPLDFFPVLDSNTFEVVHIDFAAHRTAPSGKLSCSSTAPHEGAEEEAFKASGRDRIKPPMKPFEYLPDRHKLPLRNDVKPLHISQPEGPSFKLIGDHEIEWQKWRMHVAFSGREGIAISTVTYNDSGNVRPVFYRLSLAEMVVPYAATEFPHPRKFAFDVGEYGMGTQANDLTLGCDCLGTIHYMPGTYISHSGEPLTIKKAICIHEEDDGILWKHTDFRPGGRAHVVRSRRLVISMVCTVANYEYAFYYYFGQDGTVSFSIRLTGILNVYVLAPGEPSAPFGTTIAPQINAHYHQHIFSFRIDPMIDGLANSVVESDIVPLGAPTGSAENYAGNGFIVKDQYIKTEAEGGRSHDSVKDRRWRIVNRQKTHYASGQPSGYVILGTRGACVDLLANSDSWAAKRAAFATKSLWVTRDNEAFPFRSWPAGRYVPQTRDSPSESVSNWCKGDNSVDGEDIVCFLTMGINHIPRPEDWPVMPAEKLEISLKPVHFFDQNPAIDVPGSKDCESRLAFGDGVGEETAEGEGATGTCRH